MQNKRVITMIILLLAPITCFGANKLDQGFNWSTIISSAIIGGVFGLALMLDKKNKKHTGILYKNIGEIGNKGIIKNFKIAITFIIIFGMFYLIFIPLLLNNSSDTSRFIISLIITLLIALIYKKINKK